MTRPLVDGDRIVRLMDGIGRRATGPGRVYLVGGSSAVIVGWRDATVGADYNALIRRLVSYERELERRQFGGNRGSTP